MKLKHLESGLQRLRGFKDPKVLLEQYVTQPHVAACMLHTAESQYEDISGKMVADLGCGCGVLSIASVLMGCDFCYSIDIDEDALGICLENARDMDVECMEVVQSDVNSLARLFKKPIVVDTVIMNPPFGTKQNQGIDIKFLEVAAAVARTSVYSLHKTSTRPHVLKKAKEFGMTGEVVAELRYDLPATYKFHKSKSKDIAVDFFRFEIA